MRKIESLMNSAIEAKSNWHSANTQVCWDCSSQVSEVYLHGNLIARIGECFIQLFDGNYQSNTTKSRLHSILQAHGNGQDKIYQKNYTWYVNDTVFQSGMYLN